MAKRNTNKRTPAAKAVPVVDPEASADADKAEQGKEPKIYMIKVLANNQLGGPDGTFFPGPPKPVKKITSWIQCQINAGLMKIVEL